MFSALFSFLGGSVFRMVWGEVSSFVNKREDHKQELAMMQIQAQLDAEKHTRDMEGLRLQAELGLKTLEVQTQATIEKGDADAFAAAMSKAFTPTGITWVDAWNGLIRPAAATIVLFLWVAKLASQGFTMRDYDQELSGVVLGFFFANRALGQSGK